MTAAKAAREAAMLPWAVLVKPRVVAAGVMTDPGFAVHMGRIRMTFPVTEVPGRLRLMRTASVGLGPTARNDLMRRLVVAVVAAPFMMLRKRGNGKNKQRGKGKLNGLHRFLRAPTRTT